MIQTLRVLLVAVIISSTIHSGCCAGGKNAVDTSNVRSFMIPLARYLVDSGNVAASGAIFSRGPSQVVEILFFASAKDDDCQLTVLIPSWDIEVVLGGGGEMDSTSLDDYRIISIHRASALEERYGYRTERSPGWTRLWTTNSEIAEVRRNDYARRLNENERTAIIRRVCHVDKVQLGSRFHFSRLPRFENAVWFFDSKTSLLYQVVSAGPLTTDILDDSVMLESHAYDLQESDLGADFLGTKGTIGQALLSSMALRECMRDVSK